jgi:hypothetical protein
LLAGNGNKLRVVLIQVFHWLELMRIIEVVLEEHDRFGNIVRKHLDQYIDALLPHCFHACRERASSLNRA